MKRNGRGEHHSQAWTSYHGWLHRAISLSRGHLIFQAHSTWWALRQWKLHLDGHLIHLMSLGRRTLIYFDHLWSLESVTRHTYKSYKAHLKLYLWCCPLQEWKSRAWKTPGGYLWRLQRAPFLFSSFFGLRGWQGGFRSSTLRSARLYQLLLGVVALCELLKPGDFHCLAVFAAKPLSNSVSLYHCWYLVVVWFALFLIMYISIHPQHRININRSWILSQCHLMTRTVFSCADLIFVDLSQLALRSLRLCGNRLLGLSPPVALLPVRSATAGEINAAMSWWWLWWQVQLQHAAVLADWQRTKSVAVGKSWLTIICSYYSWIILNHINFQCGVLIFFWRFPTMDQWGIP